jgi:hypothetical protein
MNAPRPSSWVSALALGLSIVLMACGNGDDSSSGNDAGPGNSGTGGHVSAGTGGATGGTSPTTGAGGSAGTGVAGQPGGASGTAGAGGHPGGGATAGSAGATAGSAGHAGGSTGSAGTGGHGGASGASGVAGSSGTGAGGAPAAGQVFGQCRFHFGTIDSIATGSPAMIPQLDFFTPGWMGQKDTFDMGSVCTEANPGGKLASQVPVIVAYVAAFYVKRHNGLCDCNVTTCGANNDLCHTGAADINNNLSNIVNVYKSYAQGLASCYGTTRPLIFEMEPDFYQYTISSQTQPWTEAQAGQIMSQFVNAVKSALPNAVFSMDISPWVAPNDGGDNGATWYANFNLSLFTFINTSGGSTSASTAKIRGDAMTWAGVSKVTGKPILADTGYGVNGSSAGPDPAWDAPANINARIADGVVSVSQYNPAATWGTTISANRSQLNTPRFCP